MSEQSMMPVVILDWKPLAKNSLLGFVKLRLGALEIIDVTIHCKEGSYWAGLPSKAQIDRDGNTRKADGKVQYSPVIAWSTKEARDRFSASVIAALREKHPNALN